ncbi:MAG: HAD-IIIC family phosphatase [Candidatus Accumulibacter sp.]|nr:HAD-IIIC family phosphatase [Accumulibacter sp.]
MAKTNPSFEDLLASETRAELRAVMAVSRIPLSLPEAQKLVSHLEALEPPAHRLRLGIVHSYTSQLMDPWLSLAAAIQGLELQTYHAPYGVTVQEAKENSGLLTFAPDITLLLLQREDLHPDLAKPLARLGTGEQDELRAEVLGRLAGLIGQFRKHKVGQIVLSLLPAIHAPGLGIFDVQSDRSESAWWSRLKVDIGRLLGDSGQASLILDTDEVVQEIGRANFFDRRLWYSARFPFTPVAAREIARRIVALGVLIKLPKAKVIVLDADNTLWGGIIGEDGMAGIALGPDYPGNTFVDFQRRLLDYQQRGFILALCSKNNAGDLDQVLKEHPHQLLRDEHFAARRVNWQSKADNLISLAEELNLGLDSFLFVDDSDHECAAVRQRLPQVEVIQTPSRAIDIPRCLEHVARLEVLSLTAEDLVKTEMYAQERRRRELKDHVEKDGADIDEYLASLKMKMQVSFDNSTHLARLAQLTQKTNQFNLTTRRYNEHQMQKFIAASDWLVADFSLVDIFGHSGVAGLAIVHFTDTQQAELDTFLLSCRVIGREAERAFLHFLLGQLSARGVKAVVADYLPTAKNELVKSFLPEQGFAACPDGRYRWNLGDTPPQPETAFPITVTLDV